MKILVIGMLGSGKSSVAYELNKRYNLPRLLLDEVQRCPKDGTYYNKLEQFNKLYEFLEVNDDWVIEGCQRYLYEDLNPDIIIYTDISILRASYRILRRFNEAQKLIGTDFDPDVPVQPYHYRENKFAKVREYTRINKLIAHQIDDFLYFNKFHVAKVKSKRNYKKLFQKLEKNYEIGKAA